MAGEGATPLRLKDLLELDCDSCSASGFRCYPRCLPAAAPPARHLLQPSSSEAALGVGRSPSLRRPSGRLSVSSLSRSLSRRLRDGFWRRHAAAADDSHAPAAACGFGSEPETASESSDSSGRTSRSRSLPESDSELSSASSASTSESMHTTMATVRDEHELQIAMKKGSKEEGCSSSSEADDKEQLSPVAVMDFPFEDDEEDGDARDDGECSPSCDDGHATRPTRLQRRKMQPQHMIRRFESLDELRPVNLDALLAATAGPDALDADEDDVQCRVDAAKAAPRSSSGHRGVDEPDERGLLALLPDAIPAGVDDASERLLLDFFVEMKRRRRSDEEHAEQLPAPATTRLLHRKAERLCDGEILAAARGWLDGTGATGRWGLKDVLRGGEAVMAEMERGRRRWMEVGEEERQVGVVVAGMLVDQLVDEVVRDLLV
ncbi:hypothetical protein ACP70R_019525 [Stipagrostis hirtigluma subsp. patula]